MDYNMKKIENRQSAPPWTVLISCASQLSSQMESLHVMPETKWPITFRKLSLVALLLLLVFLLLACQTDNDIPVQKVGIVMFGDSRQPQVRGFIEGMAQLGYDEGKQISYLIRNAKNERSKLTSFVRELSKQNIQLLVAAGGLEADTMKKIVVDQGIPVVVLYTNAIKERGLVESRRYPGWEVTGVDNLNAELSGKRVEVLKELVPGIHRILVLYYKKIAPSRIGMEQAQQIAIRYGLDIDARAVSSREEIKQVMGTLQIGDVDAMLAVPTAPIDNALKDIILPNLKRLRIPLMTYSRPMAEIGALASYGANFYDMGVQSARLADKVLKGIKPSSIPFETPKQFVYTVNQDVAKFLGLKFSDISLSQINEYVTTVK